MAIERLSMLTDDTGAQTFRRYFAQFEYTAHCCIRLLTCAPQLIAVYPETYDDVLLEFEQLVEYHQVKTREESQGAWTVADVYPFLAKMYTNRNAMKKTASYHFVSNQNADTETSLEGIGLGALYKLKLLLDTKKANSTLNPVDQLLFTKFLTKLAPKICVTGGVKNNELEDLLSRTTIETVCDRLHYPNSSYHYSQANLSNLSFALQNLRPEKDYSIYSIHEMYERILLCILNKIRTANTIEGRRITAEDIEDCINGTSSISTTIDWSKVPGRTTLDKKANLAKFDETRRGLMHSQRTSSTLFKRTLTNSQKANLDTLLLSMLELQISERERLSRTSQTCPVFSTSLLSFVKAHFSDLKSRFFTKSTSFNEHVFLGLYWDATDRCHAHWHPIEQESDEQ